MEEKLIAHLSDLHIGSSPLAEETAYRLCERLLAEDIDHAVVTGNVTHHGWIEELIVFRRIFGPLVASGRMTVIPGEHDRAGDDLGRNLMRSGQRVEVVVRDGLYLVCVDSTWRPGEVPREEPDGAAADEVLVALLRAPPGCMVALATHHPLALPGHTGAIAPLVTRPGERLLARLRGRADLVLHGNEHAPRELRLWSEDERPLVQHGAGSSTALGHARLYAVRGGRPALDGRWLSVEAPPRARWSRATQEAR